MAPTFYGVLGVGPDADADAIETGYRERVREVHPDVNDDPDADAQFRRLTTAKETLLDTDERARYDRLGHASYVRHHVSCSAWEPTVPGRDDVARSHTDGVESRVRQGPERGNEAEAGGTASERTAGSAGTTGGESRRTRGTGDGQGASRGGSAGRARADAAGEGSYGAVSYATSSFWDSQRVGERYGATSDRRKSLLVRLFGGARALGPWIVVHAVFLAAAVGTSWYVYVVLLDADAVSPLLLVVLVGEIALAATLSTIHVITRIYR